MKAAWGLLLAILLLPGCSSQPLAAAPARSFSIHLADAQPAPGRVPMLDREGRRWWVEMPAQLCCKAIRSAELVFDEQHQPLLVLNLDKEAGTRLAQLSREHVGRGMAVLVDGELQMAATLRGEISGGQLALRGFASVDEAQRLLAPRPPRP